MSHLKNKVNYIYKLSIICIFLSSFMFLIWRAKYGFCFNDEAFLVSLAQRLYNGDSLIVDEWHGVQNFGTIILPFYSVFRIFNQSNEGVLLIFRYTYCILWFTVCITVYYILKEHAGAIFVFLYLILFSPHDYMTLSYNTFGIMSLLLICCIMYYIPKRKANLFLISVFSLLWIVLVLCTPYMALLYISTIAAIFILHNVKKNESEFSKNMFHIARSSVVIIFIIALIYLYVFLFSRTELDKILLSIPHILSDPEHADISIYNSLAKIINSIDVRTKIFAVFALTICISVLVFPKIKQFRGYLWIICCLLFIFSQYPFIKNNLAPTFNYHMANINILGLVSFFLSTDKNKKLFYTFWINGFIYAVLISITSNTGFMATSLALSVSGVYSIVSTVSLSKELFCQFFGHKVLKIILSFIVAFVLFTQIYSEFHIKTSRAFYDNPLPELTTEISCGAAKGLYTSETRADYYENLYNNIEWLLCQTDTEKKSFLSCTSAPYIYLDANLDFSTFSAWSFGYGNALNDRVLDYQSVNPNKIPDLIFCAEESDILPITQSGYSMLEYNGSYLFIKK